VKSTILHIASHHLMPLLLAVSLFYLFRGHNYPGGGFISGLIGTAGLVFYSLAHGIDDFFKLLRIDPLSLTGLGLLIILAAGLLPVLTGEPFMTGKWLSPSLPVLGKVHIGTPLLFDIGVYITVIGVNLKIILTLSEE